MDELKTFVFPIADVVLFPFASVPLNLHESKSIKMVRDSLNLGIPIALLLTNTLEDSNLKKLSNDFCDELVGIGLPQIIQENIDGSIFVMIKGVKKGILKTKLSDIGFPLYHFELVDDRNDLSDGHRFKLNRLSKHLKKWLEMNIKSKEDRNTFFAKVQAPVDMVSYAAHFLVEDPLVKQEILKTNVFSQKLDLVLNSALEINDYSEGKILAIS